MKNRRSFKNFKFYREKLCTYLFFKVHLPQIFPAFLATHGFPVGKIGRLLRCPQIDSIWRQKYKKRRREKFTDVMYQGVIN